MKASLIHKALTITAALVLSATAIQAAPERKMPEPLCIESQNPKLQAAIEEIIESRKPIDSLGVVLATIHDFSPELTKVAKQELHFTDRLQIVSIEKGSLADQLGLQPGDQLIQINSFYVSRGREALEQFAERVMPGVDWNGSINTTVIRDGFGQNYSIKAGQTQI